VTDLPASFRAFVAETTPDGFRRGVRGLTPDDLPPGDVVVRVAWSGVNYKDGLAARENGKVARISPLVPGIDLAGEVLDSSAPGIAVGASVLANGYDLGVSRHGGYSELQRLPADWVVPLPDGLSAREAMACGTAGFTAAMSVDALEARGLAPGSGPVLVTGAAGGLGRLAVGMLAARGYEVWAATGKAEESDRLRALGAAGVLGRDEVTSAGRPLESARWAGAIDAVGGPTMPYILATLMPGAAVASCGNAGGPSLSATVLPFILRGVNLLGIDSVMTAIDRRRSVWERIATDLKPAGLDRIGHDITLDDLDTTLTAILNGEATGRSVVDVST
jgi:putative YhdH/YhfP family quinone oxidoreductase